MKRVFKYTAFTTGLVLTMCVVVSLAFPEFLATIGEFEVVKCRALMIEKKNGNIMVGLSTEKNATGMTILDETRGKAKASGVGITKGPYGYKIGIAHEGEDKVLIGVNQYGDGMIMLIDRYGKTTIFGVPK